MRAFFFLLSINEVRGLSWPKIYIRQLKNNNKEYAEYEDFHKKKFRFSFLKFWIIFKYFSKI
jgi:hypothetical protein